MLNQFNASLWGDEAFSAVLSQRSIPDILSVISKDTSPPLYNLILHIWYQIFGTSEISIRTLSFIYYLIAIFFVYKIAAFFWGRKTGLLSALFAFMNPFFFIYAFEGRMYSILALGVCASMYFFIRLAFSKNVKGNFINRQTALSLAGYVISTAWALYSHHFGIFILFVQGLWFLYLLIRRGWKKSALIFVGFVLTAVVYLPWLPSLYNQTKLVGSGFWLGKPSIADALNLITKYIGLTKTDLLYKVILLCSLALIVIRKWKGALSKSLILVAWFFVPITVSWLISQKFTSVFYDRYLLYIIPAVSILVASRGRKIISGLIMVILLAALVQVDHTYFITPTKAPFRDLANYVKETKRGDDYLINWNSSSHHLWEAKYYGLNAPLYIPGTSELPFYVGTAQMTAADVVRTIPKNAYRVGAITSGSIDEIKIPSYSISESKQFGDLKFVWLNKAI